jgi:hypothetical protein
VDGHYSGGRFLAVRCADKLARATRAQTAPKGTLDRQKGFAIVAQNTPQQMHPEHTSPAWHKGNLRLHLESQQPLASQHDGAATDDHLAGKEISLIFGLVDVATQRLASHPAM